MVSTFFKRYRMEADLSECDFSDRSVPLGYRLVPWHPELLETHAETKYQSFADELDSHVFPCLGELDGCLRLMREITAKASFLPEVTWLAVTDGQSEPCGTIQGLAASGGVGSIQNLGVVPKHRGHGLGRSLLVHALSGFWGAGLDRVSLEVTAENRGAIRLYREAGFKVVKTVFKSAQVAYL